MFFSYRRYTMYFTGSYNYKFTSDETGEKQKLFDESGLTKIASVNGIKDSNDEMSKFSQFNESSPYDHDLDDQSLYNKEHDVADPIEDARSQLLNMDIDAQIRIYLLRALNAYNPDKKEADAKKRFQELKEAKLSKKDKKDLKEYWSEVYPKDYAGDLVDDCEIEKGKKKKAFNMNSFNKGK